ncbi:MAG: secretin N-terminal domain-containing protein [Terriglobia bacterium]
MGLSRYVGLGTAGAGLILCFACTPASVAFRDGRKAELHKDYDTAVIDYDKALQSQPDNSEFLIHEKEARTKASFFHLDRGRRDMLEYRYNEAAAEFQKAVSIDPTDQAAAQELKKLLTKQVAEVKARQEALKNAMQTRTATASEGEIQLKAMPPEPIAHLHISADSRKVFETLGKLANLNVVFYHDFQPRPISLDLTNIKIADAIQVAAYEANVFWKAVTPNTILVIPDTPNNRRMLQNEVLKTVYLSNPLTPADRTAILSALKQVVGAQQVFDNPASNSIIIRDTPEKVQAAEELIRSLDLGKAEVLIDITVLEANRDRIRDLGLAPVPLQNDTLAAIGFNPPLAAGAAAGTVPTLALNQLSGLKPKDFSIVLPGVIANALLSDTQTHIMQNPQVRVTDGMTAKLTIGSRVPIATGSFGVPTGVATQTGGFGLLANTQFQYQDVGVKLDITPHVSTNGEISLHAHIQISSEGASVNIGGIEEPTFTQRDIEHDIRLKEGEVSLLGGLLQTQITRETSGLPGLGEVPILKYLFSTTSYEKNDQEVLIMMTPRVVRLPESPSEATANLSGSSGPARPMMPYRIPGRDQ